MDWRLHYPGAPNNGVKLLTRIISQFIPKRQRKYPLETIVAAILYSTSNGCKWRALDRPGVIPWKIIYDYYRLWAKDDILERANALMVRIERRRQNRNHQHSSASEPAVIVVDAQTVKSRVGGMREALDFDGHKRIKGIARHVATDVRGHVLACACGPANDCESRWLKDVLTAVKHTGFRRAYLVVADGGYQGKELEAVVEGFELEIIKRSDLDGPKK